MENFMRNFCIFLTVVFATVATPIEISNDSKNDVRLVLQITVDGMRADLLSRYADRFNE